MLVDLARDLPEVLLGHDEDRRVRKLGERVVGERPDQAEAEDPDLLVGPVGHELRDGPGGRSVADEDDLRVDYEEIIERAVRAGYGSVMVDGSRLPLEGNIECTRRVVEIAHDAGVPVEAELGAIMGHEAGPLPPYDELFESGRGFTDPAQAKRFVDQTNVDWLSIAIGNVHGAISAARKSEKKIEARLDINRLDEIRQAAGIPLVLHGGTGISKDYILKSIQHGIAKVNVATAIRQPYEKAAQDSVAAGQEAVYRAMLAIIREDLEIEDSAARLA